MKKMFEMAKAISQYSRKEAERRYEVCRDRFSDDNTYYQNFDIAMEASMLLQRIMDLAKEDAETLKPDPDINTDTWIQVPKGDDMKYWLNKWGLRRWVHRLKKEFNAERLYYWCDRVIIMEDRKVINDITFTKFIREEFDFYNPEMPEKEEKITLEPE
jgi:hypothetical protein